MFKQAESSIASAQSKQKETYDRKHQPGDIAVGTQVLLENTAQKQRKGGKLEPAWLGPYTIHRCIGKGLYELSKDGKVVKNKANVARLKIYKKRAVDGEHSDADDNQPEDSKPADESKPVEQPDIPETTATEEKQSESEDNQPQSKPAEEKVKYRGSWGWFMELVC